MKPTLPKTKLETKLVRNMTADEVARCRQLHIRSKGRIHKDLTECLRRPHSGSRVVMVKDEQEDILSWGLIDYTESPKPSVQLYTRARYRRMGLGTRIMRKVKDILGTNEYIHFKHDNTSKAFFNAVGAIYPPPTLGTWL